MICLTRALLALIIGTLICAGTVNAQGRVSLKTVDQRLQRVEKVMDQSLLDLLQQVEGLKREIKRLRGELEAQAHELERSKKRSRDLYLDTDQRITNIERGVGSSPAVLPGVDGNPTPQDDQTGSLDNLPVFVRDSTADPPQGGEQPLPSRVNATRAATPEEQTAYTQAYDLLAARQYDAAVARFGDFLLEYPYGPYSDNAWYWQGEALYAQRKFDAAIENFVTVIESFPQSPKVPDARLKVGFAQFEQRRYKSARNTLTRVQQDYPGRSAAVLARKRLRDMNARGL